MKVGVITFHSAYNFGASLQTWALQKVLKNYGLETGVINYHPPVIDDLYDPIKKTGIKRPLKIVKLAITNRDSLKRYYHYKNFIQKNFDLIGDYKTYEELKNANLKLDAYITGSDQVWNSQHIGGFDPAYFLDFVSNGGLKISYAASIGRNYLLPKYKQDFKNSVSTFDYVSVREKSAKPVIAEITDRKVEVVLDPTLLLQKEEYEAIKVKPEIKEPYIFVYMMEDNREVVQFANKISRALGIPIIQRRQRKIFKNEIGTCYTSDAGEFIGFIEQATMVITNSFHGTVFSTIYERPFISMLHSDTGSRTIDLLKSLGLSSHIVYDPNKFNDMDQFQITNAEALRERILELRAHSLAFLEKALSIETEEEDEYVKCPTAIRKDECYGCYACKEVCPTNAITMKADKEGFYFPVVDEKTCIQCQACVKACIRKEPQLIAESATYPVVYSAMNKDEAVRMGSSSGAVFPALAQYVIENSGYVVGVKFDSSMRAVSAIADTMEDVKAFYGSKYVKSDIAGIFPKVKELLKENKLVLYTGLPCECAGLKSYLKKDYDNLLICEIVCHAAPSPKVLGKYLDYLTTKYKSGIKNLEFRNKKTGWETHKCSLVVTFENGKELSVNARRNNYFRAFQNDFISRLNCNKCQFTFKNRVGDFTIGDFWGIKEIDPEMYDEKGTSLVMINTEKAAGVWKEVSTQFVTKESNMTDAFKKNHKKPTKFKPERTELFDNLEEEPIDSLLLRFNDLRK